MKSDKVCLFSGFVLIMFIISLIGCDGSYPESPYSPDDSDDSSEDWEDVIASDSNYPENVYLTENIEFNPGQIGSARITDDSDYYDSNGYPLDETKEGACGPPEGCSSLYSNSDADMTVLGSGGEAVWKFDSDWVIIDGDGDDFVLFSNHNVFQGKVDGSWNELAHVYVSEDNVNWYISSKESYIENSTPGEANDDYDWSEVVDVFGNNHTWANFREDVAAEYLDADTESYEDLTDSNGDAVYVSKYFTPTDDYLGGDYFDLSDFVSVNDSDKSWPSDGKMRYLKLVDDPSILDGQDYSPSWMTGARLMSAMGINVEEAD
ncbi:MAG: hypothetical protein PQJ46_02795 [Spirochaetales bacterium]|nr:hypothetical protein [Spirochaetales bacterium]